jgi:Fic family protein
MIYTLPNPEDIDLDVLGLIGAMHSRLKNMISNESRRWTGSLRRSTMARAIRGSNSIEGYHASLDQAMAAVENEAPAEYSDVWRATKGYSDALTYVMQACNDPYFEFSSQFLKSLHFMMIGHEMNKNPGQWRPGPVYIVNQATAQTVYEAPDAELVNDLVSELIGDLISREGTFAPVMGAMAHLNLTMIHPFKDGNGRMARALQSLVIARAGMSDPTFCSIEEWLGENTLEYYKVLEDVGQGKWSPQNNALPFVRFCLKAHYQQAQRLVRRNNEYSTIYDKLHSLVRKYDFNERCELPLFDACIGLSVTNLRYRTETDVSEYVASRDLKKLVELEFLEPEGDGRGRLYRAGPHLVKIRKETRTPRKLDDPYEIAARKASSPPAQLALPLEKEAS